MFPEVTLFIFLRLSIGWRSRLLWCPLGVQPLEAERGEAWRVRVDPRYEDAYSRENVGKVRVPWWTVPLMKDLVIAMKVPIAHAMPQLEKDLVQVLLKFLMPELNEQELIDTMDLRSYKSKVKFDSILCGDAVDMVMGIADNITDDQELGLAGGPRVLATPEAEPQNL